MTADQSAPVATHPPAFTVTSTWDPDRARHVVMVSGELDLMTVPQLRAALAGVDTDVEVDSAALRFIDSTGLGLFMMLHALQRRHHRRLMISRLRPSCRQAFEMTGLAEVLDIQPG